MDFYIINTDESTGMYIDNLNFAAAAGEVDLGKIHLCTEDGINYFAMLLSKSTKEDSKTKDQFVPSHGAPHVLAQVLIRSLEIRGYKAELIAFPSKVGTPYEVDLEKGLKAFSFTTEQCVDSCIEPEICPTKGDDLTWDVKNVLKDYSLKNSLPLVTFECSHFLRAVSTIPMKNIISEWLEMEKLLTKGKIGQFIIATHSKCHGIAALVDVKSG